MASFSCCVLFSTSPGDRAAHVRAAVEEILAPYSEALEVDEYNRRCYCTDGGAAPDPGCPSCDGRGTYRSMYNPRAKWDWWVLARRDGAASVARPVAELLADPAAEVPSAMVTPDGEWHERGTASHHVWAATVRTLYEANRGACAVAVDLHV